MYVFYGLKYVETPMNTSISLIKNVALKCIFEADRRCQKTEISPFL